MIQSDKAGRLSSLPALKKELSLIQKRIDFVEGVPLEKPVYIHLKVRIQDTNRYISEKYVVIIQSFKESKVQCKVLAYMKSLLLLNNKKKEFYINSLMDWAIIPDHEAPLYMRPKLFKIEDINL